MMILYISSNKIVRKPSAPDELENIIKRYERVI